jgi:hypothetical protein
LAECPASLNNPTLTSLSVFSDWSIRDPALTKVGRLQASGLEPLTHSGVQMTAELLVSSPVSPFFLGAECVVVVIPMWTAWTDYLK